MVHFRSFPPPPALAATVAELWTLDGHGPAAGRVVNRVLPDGCLDVIVNSEGPTVGADGTVENPHASYAVGTMTRALCPGHRGRVRLTGVRFRPGMAGAFLALPAAELTDGVAPLDALWGGMVRILEAGVAEAGSAAARARYLATVLQDRTRPEWRPDPAVMAALAEIRRSGGQATGGAMVRAAGVGERRLQRAFAVAVGVPPKVAARVARFRRALRLAAAEPHLTWGAVAARCGYADQPHLVREFRALAGVTPGEWREEADTP